MKCTSLVDIQCTYRVGKPGDKCPNVNNRGVPARLWSEDGTELDDGEGDKCYKYGEVFNIFICVSSFLNTFSSRLSPFIVVPKGVNATAGLSEFPFMALLGFKDNRIKQGGIFYSCGGSLINRRYVLTAAHCMPRGNPDVVALGEHNLGRKCDCDIVEGEESCNEPTQIVSKR